MRGLPARADERAPSVLAAELVAGRP
jgi:hypothetical protein